LAADVAVNDSLGHEQGSATHFESGKKEIEKRKGDDPKETSETLFLTIVLSLDLKLS
jgi:hypothetical protein